MLRIAVSNRLLALVTLDGATVRGVPAARPSVDTRCELARMQAGCHDCKSLINPYVFHSFVPTLLWL